MGETGGYGWVDEIKASQNNLTTTYFMLSEVETFFFTKAPLHPSTPLGVTAKYFKKTYSNIGGCLLLFFFFSSSYTFSQQKEKEEDDLKKEIVIDKKRYKIYNNWLTLGAGPAYNSGIPYTQFALGTNYSFHINKYYFQGGIMLSGEDMGDYNNTQFHLCYGLRKETKKYNLAFFIGPSFTNGFEYLDSTYSEKIFQKPGAYAELQFTGKIKYDVGCGPALFIDVNAIRTIVGLRLDLYFSGAYKGKQ